MKHNFSLEEGVELLCLAPHAAIKPFGMLSSSLAMIVVDLKSFPQPLSFSCGPMVLWVSPNKVATAKEVLRVEAKLLSNMESKEHFLES